MGLKLSEKCRFVGCERTLKDSPEGFVRLPTIWKKEKVNGKYVRSGSDKWYCVVKPAGETKEVRVKVATRHREAALLASLMHGGRSQADSLAMYAKHDHLYMCRPHFDETSAKFATFSLGGVPMFDLQAVDETNLCLPCHTRPPLSSSSGGDALMAVAQANSPQKPPLSSSPSGDALMTATPFPIVIPTAFRLFSNQPY